ncbi:MAG: manganese efflux pump [Deltaproteobacteria bacterium]|nr:manganese efflux pump [Deltaproteobacteria bacterium]
MGWLTLIGISVALAMDAFAVAIAAGLQLRPLTSGHVFRLSFHFGLFQAVMPILGWLAGTTVQRYIAAYDHWIALALLGFIGGKLIVESRRRGEEERVSADPTRGWTLVALSFATSIDALAVGLSLAMLRVSIWVPSLVIGVVCAAFTVTGMLIGWRVGRAWSRRVELVGGLVLIAIGVKIVLEHTLGK